MRLEELQLAGADAAQINAAHARALSGPSRYPGQSDLPASSLAAFMRQQLADIRALQWHDRQDDSGQVRAMIFADDLFAILNRKTP